MWCVSAVSVNKSQIAEHIFQAKIKSNTPKSPWAWLHVIMQKHLICHQLTVICYITYIDPPTIPYYGDCILLWLHLRMHLRLVWLVRLFLLGTWFALAPISSISDCVNGSGSIGLYFVLFWGWIYWIFHEGICCLTASKQTIYTNIIIFGFNLKFCC